MDYFNTTHNEVSKSYDELVFYPRPLQSRELNVLQGIINNKIHLLIRSIYEEGTLLQGDISTDGEHINLKGCYIMVNGRFHKINTKIKNVGKYILGRITKKEISSKDDKTLLDPALGTNKNNPGADRIQYISEIKTSNTIEDGYVKIGTVVNNRVTTNTPSSLNEAKQSIYDHVIHNLDFSEIGDNTRILVKGGIFHITDPITIQASDIQIDFSPGVKVLGTHENKIPYFFDLQGENISMTGLKVGWQKKPSFEVQDVYLNNPQGKTPGPFTRLTRFGADWNWESPDSYIGKVINWEGS